LFKKIKEIYTGKNVYIIRLARTDSIYSVQFLLEMSIIRSGSNITHFNYFLIIMRSRFVQMFQFKFINVKNYLEYHWNNRCWESSNGKRRI